jgi:HAD superfamily hydrolase (TIGR01484 family)
MVFKAAMFDFDGTVTEKGQYMPTPKMAEVLVDLSHKMPIAFCTGRQLESFEAHGLKYLQEEISPKNLEKFYENLFLFAENGAIGYQFNSTLDEFEEFYRVKWPEEFCDQLKLKDELSLAVKDIGEVFYNAHQVVIVIRTKLYYVKESERDMKEVYLISKKIFKIITDLLKKIDKNFEKYVHVGNAGIGVVIGPANGDKDMAISRFARYLQENRGIQFTPKAREILVVGDQAQKGGNDYYFLKGTFGTPYTVGLKEKGQKYPLEVFAGDEKLFNAAGTMSLIKSLL